MDLVKYVREKQLKEKIPRIKPGNIVAVHQRIKEGAKERVQIFKGIVIKVKGGYSIDGSLTVRKVASGVGVEKSFMFNSPSVEKIEVLKQAKVRRAKLYYLRGRFGKSARLNLMDDDKGASNLMREVVGEEVEVAEKEAEKVVANDEKVEKEVKKEKTVKAEVKEKAEKKSTKKEEKKR